MDGYDRILTSKQLAETVLQSCFRILDSETYLNYNKVLCIYETLHLISITSKDGIPYRHITPDEIRSLYMAYTEVAEDTYSTHVQADGGMKAVPSNKDIPQWIFDIVAEITNLTRRE